MENRYKLTLITLLFCAATALSQAVSSSNASQQTATLRIPKLVSAAAMDEQDAALLESRHAAIVRAARIYGYDLEAGSWTTNLAECPDAPGYLIAQMNDGNESAESFFTVLVPRKDAPPRIVPVLRKGILNSWTFGEDKLQREFLDQLIAVKEKGAEPGGTAWANLAGCYAALQGTELSGKDVENSVVVDVANGGKLQAIDFVGVQPNGEQATWKIEYDARGRIRTMEIAREKFQVVKEGPAHRQVPFPSSEAQNWKPIPPPK